MYLKKGDVLPDTTFFVKFGLYRVLITKKFFQAQSFK
jgi:hypothetical protein